MSANTKTLGLLLVLGMAMSTLAAGQAASTPAGSAAPVKIGIIAIQVAIANTNEGKKDLDGLQQRFAPKQTQLKNLNDEIEGLTKQLQAQGEKLSEDARNTQVRAIESKKKALQRDVQDAQDEYQQAQQEIFNRVGVKMSKILEAYAVKHGYGVILDVSNPQTPVLYASETSNITKEIVDAYNAQSPVGAATKPAGATVKPKPEGAASAAAAKTGSTAGKP